MKEIELSDYGRASTVASPVNRMMSAFAADFRDGVDVNLGVGYVNEETIPHELIAQALAQVTERSDTYRTPFNYGGAAGSPNLLASIRRFYIEQGWLSEEVLNRQEIIVGASGATSLLEAVAAILPPGLVITTDPIYYIFCELLQRQGFELLAVPEDGQGIDTAILRTKIDQLGDRRHDVRFFYIVSVNNPTCTILSDKRRRELVDIANDLSRQLNRKVPVIFDTAYEMLIHDSQIAQPQSPLRYDELGLVYQVGTLSKILAPALRIGYMFGPPGEFTLALTQKVSDVGFSAPLLAQEIASWLLDHHVTEQIATVNRGYRDKATRLCGWLDHYLGSYLARCDGGQAGFYFYLTFKNLPTHERSPLFRYLARCTGDESVDGPSAHRYGRVVYVPGEFCVAPGGDLVEIGQRQLRIAYGFEESSEIEWAIRVMGDAAAHASS